MEEAGGACSKPRRTRQARRWFFTTYQHSRHRRQYGVVNSPAARAAESAANAGTVSLGKVHATLACGQFATLGKRPQIVE